MIPTLLIIFGLTALVGVFDFAHTGDDEDLEPNPETAPCLVPAANGSDRG